MPASHRAHIRPMNDGDWPGVVELLVGAFGGPRSLTDTYRRRMGDGGFRVAEVDGAVVGTLSVYRLAQHWGGRAVPMGGIAGVAVAPEARGQGIAVDLVAATLRELRAEGIPLSALYASTQQVYRKVGFEQAGNRVTWALPLADIHASDRTLPVERIDDSAALAPLYRPEHGNLVRSATMWERIVQVHDGETRVWTFGDQGYAVLLTPNAQPDQLVVRDFCLHTAAATRRFLTLLADHRSIVQTVRWTGACNEPLLLLLPEARWKAEKVERWMLRVADLPAALVARGWPANARGALHLDIDDPVLPENSGRFVLELDGGQASVQRGGRGELRVSMRGLAPLYSGLIAPRALVGLGLVEGDDAAVATASDWFAGPEPFMREGF